MKAYYAILLILLIVVIVFSCLTYFRGLFEGTVRYSSFEIGNKDTRLFESGSNDYVLTVDFESKGAFIAGREIHVSIGFIANQEIDKFKQSQLLVVFPGAAQFPVPGGEFRIADASVPLALTDDASAHVEADIVYFMPEKYTYQLIIDQRPQANDQFTRKNAYLYLAPLETELQLKNNRIVLVLTFFAIYIAIVSVILAWVFRH